MDSFSYIFTGTDETRVALLSNWGDWGRSFSAINSLTTMITNIGKVLEASFNMLFTWWTGMPFGKIDAGVYDSLVTRTETSIKWFQTVNPADYASHIVSMRAIAAVSGEFDRALPRLVSMPGMAAKVSALHKALSTVAKIALNTIAQDDSAASETVCVMLVGPPQTGKSTFTPILTNLLSKALRGTQLAAADIYSMNLDTAHVDGYNSQFATCIDDCTQDVSEEALKRLFNFIIHAVNKVPFMLPQANISEGSNLGKGNNFFKSQALICTANAWPLNNYHGFDEFAVNRRIHAVIKFTDLLDDANLNAEQAAERWLTQTYECGVFTAVNVSGTRKSVWKPLYPDKANLTLFEIADYLKAVKERLSHSTSLSKDCSDILYNKYEVKRPLAPALPALNFDVAPTKTGKQQFEEVKDKIALAGKKMLESLKLPKPKEEIPDIGRKPTVAQQIGNWFQPKVVHNDTDSAKSSSSTVFDPQGRIATYYRSAAESAIYTHDKVCVMDSIVASGFEIEDDNDSSVIFMLTDYIKPTFPDMLAKAWKHVKDGFVPTAQDALVFAHSHALKQCESAVSILDEIKRFFAELWTSLPFRVCTYLGAAAALIGAGIGLYFALRPDPPNDPESRLDIPGKLKPNATIVYSPHGAIDINGFQSIVQYSGTNVWTARVEYQIDETPHSMTALMTLLDSGTGITVNHLFARARSPAAKNASLTLSLRQNSFKFPLDTLDCVIWDKGPKEELLYYDMITVNFPKNWHFREVRNIRDKFILLSDVARLNTEKISIAYNKEDTTIILPGVAAKIAANTIQVYDIHHPKDPAHAKDVFSDISYTIDIFPGSCGGLGAILDKNVPRKLALIHKAGTAGKGQGTLITQELLKRFAPLRQSFFPPPRDFDIPDEIILEPHVTTHDTYWSVDHKTPHFFRNGVAVIAECKPDVPFPGQPNCDIIKSPISHLLPYTSTSAPTKGHDWVRHTPEGDVTLTPLVNALFGINKPELVQPLAYAPFVEQLIQSKLTTIVGGSEMSEYEVLRGRPSLAHAVPLRMQTSAGLVEFPQKTHPKKSYFVFEDDKAVAYSASFRKKVEALRHQWRHNLPRFNATSSCIKIELRDEETKVNLGSERLFFIKSLTELCASKHLWGTTIAQDMENQFEPSSVTGISVDNLQGMAIIAKHTAPGLSRKHSCVDATRFDVTDSPLRLLHNSEVRIKNLYSQDLVFYGKDKADALCEERKVQALDSIYPLVTVSYKGRKFLVVLCGIIASGDIMTTHKNNDRTDTNAAQLYCKYKEMKDPSFVPTVAKFRHDFRLDQQGDDFWGTPHETVSDFNTHFIVKHAPSVTGTLYGSALKGEDPRDFELHEVSFLKSAPVNLDGMWMFALAEKTLHNSVHWISKGQPPKEATRQTVDSALRKWACHGPEVFERERLILVTACLAAGVDVSGFPSYDAIVRTWISE